MNASEAIDKIVDWYMENECIYDDPDQMTEYALEKLDGMSDEEIVKFYEQLYEI